MSEPKKKSKKKKKYKKRSYCNNNNQNTSDNSYNNQSSSNEDPTSKLCCFSSLDYIVLASTLAVALGEELSTTDISILSTFFAVLSDELALIASINACSTNGETPVFVPPVPDVAATSSQNRSKNMKKKK